MSKRTCTTAGCDKQHYGRGWCKYHYQQAYLAGNIESQPRKISRPDATLDERLRNIGWTVTESGCWEWNGAKDVYGYGQMSVNRGRPWKAYRIAYEAWVKVPADNVDICHTCDNPPCINPAHLFEGSRLVNITDMVNKKRIANGERKPHKLTDVQIDEIRAHYATGGFMQKELAARYGVTSSHICNIVRYKARATKTNPKAA
jgi:hypothetical protein